MKFMESIKKIKIKKKGHSLIFSSLLACLLPSYILSESRNSNSNPHSFQILSLSLFLFPLLTFFSTLYRSFVVSSNKHKYHFVIDIMLCEDDYIQKFVTHHHHHPYIFQPHFLYKRVRPITITTWIFLYGFFYFGLVTFLV